MILRTSDAKVVSCLMKLRSVEFEPLVRWLEAHRDERVSMLKQVGDQTNFRMVQGHVHVLDDLLTLVDKAPTLVAK